MSELIQLSNLNGAQAPWMISRKEVIPAEPARVWKALTSPEELTAWWCNAAEIDPREGGRYAFRGSPACGHDELALEGAETPKKPGNFEILEWVPAERLRYRWWIGGVETTVAYELQNMLELTELFVTQSAQEPPRLSE